MSSSKIIVLKSSDGETFEVEEAVALESQTIKHKIDTPKSDDNSNKTAEDDVKAFDAEFVKVDQGTLFDLILEKHLVAEADQNARQNEKVSLSEPIPASVSGNPDTIDDAIDSFKDMPAIEDETDTLSDIDDVEVNCYLNNEKESRFKKIIWEEMNKEYLQEQAAKEAAAAAARKIYSEASDDVRSAQELAAAAAAAVARSRETRRQKRAEEAKKAGLAQTAAEATRQMLTKKRLSSKINYDVLDKLFDDSTRENQNVKEQNRLLGEFYMKPAPTTKKNRADDDDNSNATGKQLGKKEKEVDNENFDEQDGEDEDMEGKYGFGEENNQWLYGNEQEMYDYNYDDQDGYDEY